MESPLKSFTLSYLATLAVMIGLDAIWLTATAGPLYRAHLGAMLLPAFSPVPAIAFYLLYALGLVVFAVLPALAGGWRGALWRGAFFGLVAYATYDLTNQATLRGWSTTVTLADLAWGTTVSGLAASGGWIISRMAWGCAQAPGGRKTR